jgi:beta-lactamase regulating signal transducer with metallopeptidase domain
MAPWIDIAGWTLLHFVWQGTAVGLAAAAGFRLLRTTAPHVRYLLASAAMATMLMAPVATAARLSSSASAHAAPRISASMISSAPATRSPDVVARDVAATSAVRALAGPSRLDAVLPAIVLLWLTGVALLQLRLIGGWWRVRRLHRASLATTPSAWQAMMEPLAKRLGLRHLVHVVETHAVDVPTVIGWWRPVILLPVGALAGLTPGQADAILVHELAHIRRHDYLVNALQHVTETLLFYHPAVWWISRRIRIEREHCCDAVVIQLCGDPIDYAEALAELEGGRSRRLALAVAATDGSLVHRIRVLLGTQPSHQRPLADALVTALVVAVLVVVTGGGYRWPTRAVHANVDAAPRVQTPAAGTDAVVVTVNGEAITDRDLRRRQEAFKRDRPNAPLSEVLVAAVDERLIEQRGKQLGYGLSDDQFQSSLRNLMAQNGLATDAALQDALDKEQLTLADLRRNIESYMIASRLRFSMTATPVTDAEARDYFSAHVEDFPLQTFELARPRIEELLANAHRGSAWGRFVQEMRSTAVLVWQQPDYQRAYEAGRAAGAQQGRADVPQSQPAVRPSRWQTYSTDHFDVFFTPDLNTELERVGREAERAYQRLSADLRHDLGARLNLVLFATGAARDSGVGVPSAAAGTQSRILLALDRSEDRFRADVAHEVTHAFEFDILPAAVVNDGPAWIQEGLAEHEGEVWASGDDVLLRGLVRTDSVPALSAFERPAERRLSYCLGHAAFDFIAARWGMDGIRRLLFTLRQRQAADRGGLYPAAFGIPAEEFDQAFERYLRDRFPPGQAAAPAPQGAAAQRVVGQKVSEQLKCDTASHVTVDTVTLSFAGDATAPTFTIDLITQYIPERPAAPPGAVDVVVSLWPTEDDTPAMALRVDGQSRPLIARLRGRRSLVSTISLIDLQRFVTAGSLVEHAFDTDLEVSSTQLVMLRRIVDGWVARLER